MTLEVSTELLIAGILLPLSRIQLDHPFSKVVMATDAAPGGHGLAYADVSEPVAQVWSRTACHRGGYTSLLEEHAHLAVPEAQHSNFQMAKLPLHGYRWHEVSKPGGYQHIALEEFDAANWGLLHRVLSGTVSSRETDSSNKK